MDCFYAAVEIRDQPHLSEHPVAVGGKASGRGVLTTCNYKAREFGLHSAMPAAQALKLCPNLVLLPVRMDLYKDASRHIHQIFHQYTDTIEPLSLDEAYLDVSGSTLHRGSATLIAQDIRKQIFQEQSLAASAGIAGNKFLAKVASDWNKPNGQFVITPDSVSEFVKQLPVKRIPGVGPVTQEKLGKLGIQTCEQLQEWTLNQLINQFGRFGENLFNYSRGLDDRRVKTSRDRKSLSVETTFSVDLEGQQAIDTVIPELMEELSRRLEKANQSQELNINGLFVKIKYFDFKTTTHQCPGYNPDILQFTHLIHHCLENRNVAVRLVGIGVRFESKDTSGQLSLL